MERTAISKWYAFREKKKKKQTNYNTILASMVARLVKNLPAMQETQVRFLGQEDTLEK